MLDRRQFLLRAAGAGLAIGGLGGVRPAWADLAAGSSAPLPRGVTYDTGTLTLGETTRRVWSAARVEDEIGAIADRLGCSTVTVFGSAIDRLEESARVALRHGLQVSIQPRLYDYSQAEILRHLAEAGARAEQLRGEHPGAVTLIAGCEHMLFTPGIVPGRTFEERIAALGSGKVDFELAFRRLAAFLARAAKAGRRSFAGPLTYAAAEFEPVDWTLFDLVGLDYYAFHESLAGHRRTLRPYRRWGKPIAILEFGCCTYRGAPRRGGSGYDVVDYAKVPPVLRPGIVRSEATQADYIAHMFDVFAAERLHSASVYTFIAPDLPRLPDPRRDLDTASFAIVETLRERPEDPASPYRWRPKKAFAAVRDHGRRPHRARPDLRVALSRR
jgi:hypothetical protein